MRLMVVMRVRITRAGEIKQKGEATVRLLFGDKTTTFCLIFIEFFNSLMDFFYTMKKPNNFDLKVSTFARKKCESGALSVNTRTGDACLLGSWTDGGKCMGVVVLFCRKFNSLINQFDTESVFGRVEPGLPP